MKKPRLVCCLMIACLLCLNIGVALAADCAMCGDTGYVAMKVANSDEYVAVPCPECSGKNSPSGKDTDKESIAETTASPMEYFPGYTEWIAGETVNVKGVGKFMFHELHIGEELYERFHTPGQYGDSDFMLRVWAEGHYDNTSTSTQQYRYLFSDVQLHYINEDNIYSYEPWTIGEYDGSTYFSSKVDKGRGSSLFDVSGDGFIRASIDPLDDNGFIIGFQYLPERIIEDEDGIVAITFQLMGSDEKYVFFGRP